MKRVFFIAVLVPLSVGLFAQQGNIDSFTVNTSEGVYLVMSEYKGKNRGQQTVDETIKLHRDLSIYEVQTDISLTGEQWDMVRQALSRTETSRGDTYYIFLQPLKSENWQVVIEFTSSTQYRYWIWKIILRRQ